MHSFTRHLKKLRFKKGIKTIVSLHKRKLQDLNKKNSCTYDESNGEKTLNSRKMWKTGTIKI